MTLGQFWTTLIKRWMLILFCVLVGGGGAYLGSQFATRSYQSTVVVQIVIHKNTNIQFVQTEVQLATSNPVLQTVAAHYSGLTSVDLAREVIAKALVATTPTMKLFQINVVDQSPTRAAILANDIATLLIKQFQAAYEKNFQSQQQTQQNITSIQQQMDALTGQITALEVEKAPAAKISNLQTQLDVLQKYQVQQQSVLRQLKLAQARNADSLSIAQRAEPARTPTRPDVLLDTGTACLAGFLLGLLLALLLEQLDTRVGTIGELKQQLLVWAQHITVRRSGSVEEGN